MLSPSGRPSRVQAVSQVGGMYQGSKTNLNANASVSKFIASRLSQESPGGFGASDSESDSHPPQFQPTQVCEVKQTKSDRKSEQTLNLVESGFVLNKRTDYVKHNVSLVPSYSKLGLSHSRTNHKSHSLTHAQTGQSNLSRVGLELIHSQSPARYVEQRKFQRMGAIDHANMVLQENPFDIASYRADNKKLRVTLPGELHHQHMQKPQELRKQIDRRKLQDYIQAISQKKLNDQKQETTKVSSSNQVTRKPSSVGESDAQQPGGRLTDHRVTLCHLNRQNAHLPPSLSKYLHQKRASQPEPELERTLNHSDSVQHSQVKIKQAIDTVANNKILSDIRAAAHLRNNKAVSGLVDVIKARNTKPSATCLTGISAYTDLMHHFKKFNVDSRINRFRAEDFYLIRNYMPLEEEPPLRQKKSYLDKNKEVIHVMIDQASLQSLRNIGQQPHKVVQTRMETTQDPLNAAQLRGNYSHEVKQSSAVESQEASVHQSHDWKNKSLKSLAHQALDKHDGSRGDTLLLEQKESGTDHLRNKDMLSPTSNQSIDNIIETKYDPNSYTNEVGVGFGVQERMRTDSSRGQDPELARARQPLKTQSGESPSGPSSGQKPLGRALQEPVVRILVREESAQQLEIVDEVPDGNATFGQLQNPEDELNQKLYETKIYHLPLKPLQPEAVQKMRQISLKLQDGRISPGEAIDLETELCILKLNAELRAANFGQDITEALIDDKKPAHLNRESTLLDYRKWRKCTVSQQRLQIQERVDKFGKVLGQYKQQKKQVAESRELARYGYPKAQMERGQMPIRILMRSEMDRGRFVQLNPLVELRVRELLQDTELTEIAKTAKIVVSIVKDEKQKAEPSLVARKLDLHPKVPLPSLPQ